jgi:hypothetical protein
MNFCIFHFYRTGGPGEKGYYQLRHDDINSTYCHHFYNREVFLRSEDNNVKTLNDCAKVFI